MGRPARSLWSVSLAPALAAVLAACASATATSSAASALGEVGAIPPGVQLTTKYREYEVSASTVAELRRELQREGPEVEGRRFAGATRWNLRWMWRYDRRGFSCALADVRVTVDADVEMPRWRPADGSSLDSASHEWWRRFHARLLEHERGHVRLALDGAREIEQALRPLTGGACDALGDRANTSARALFERLRERQALYDRETRHGALPPSFPTTRTP